MSEPLPNSDPPAAMPEAVVIDCQGLTTRAIGAAVWAAIDLGSKTARLENPGARHSLGVALPEGFELVIAGSAGYYAGGLSDGATIRIEGNAGWGAAESQRAGTVVIAGNAGNAVAASIRSGLVVVRGNASTRAGIGMKGGALVVAGDAGPMAGFMMQKGAIVIVGDAGDGVADSMYEGTIYLGGQAGELGADAVFQEMGPTDLRLIEELLERAGLSRPVNGFRKLVAGRKLWNFRTSERAVWKGAL